jgi:hypothetical protein
MITSELKIEEKEKIEYDPIPSDVYQVEVLDINEKTVPQYKDKTKNEQVLEFQFTLLEGNDKGKDLRGRNLWRNYVPTYLYIGKNGKNVLYQIIEAIFNREISPDEKACMDRDFINSLIGRQCRVLVENSTKDNKTFSNIKSFLTIKSLLTPLTAEEKEKAAVKKKDEEEIEECLDPETGQPIAA